MTSTLWVKAVGLLFLCGMAAGCSCGGKPCQIGDPAGCPTGERCEAQGDQGVCKPIASCNPNDASTCPGGFVCRPSPAGPACEPKATAGRIPGCVDSAGMDVFIVEASTSLSVTWNVNAALDHAGGFKVEYGTATETYSSAVTAGAEVREALLPGLQNGTHYFVVVRALSGSGAVTFTSCEVFARPHVLEFQPDVRANSSTSGTQQTPALASNLEGTRLHLVWDDVGTISYTGSTDFGDSWSTKVAVTAGGMQRSPSLAVREAVIELDGGVVAPETAFISWEESGQVRVARYAPGSGTFEAPVTVGSGTRPSVAVGANAVHLTYESGGSIFHSRSLDDGLSFVVPVAISGGTTEAHGPSAVVNKFTGDVYVAWDAKRGQGNTDIFSAASTDRGVTFGSVVRVDDDSSGQNQSNVSLAIDERSQKLYATWEDRRGGANVYFTWSEDWGSSFKASVDVGAGLGGDQFHPRATIDPARNVYVAFQDTTNGARIVFSRFSTSGTFDPPLAPSRSAGVGGVVADFPAVATDRYGTVYVAWQENRSGPDIDVFFSRAQ